MQLAMEDFSDEFVVSNKLYGCESEMQRLSRALNRLHQLAVSGRPSSHLTIINGPSGSGKSFVVSQVCLPACLFAFPFIL
jgi:excinuclease UvrABC ATPase subunit